MSYFFKNLPSWFALAANLPKHPQHNSQGAHLLQRCRAQLIACIHQLPWPICSEQFLNSRDLRVKRKELPSLDVLALWTYPTPKSSSSIQLPAVTQRWDIPPSNTAMTVLVYHMFHRGSQRPRFHPMERSQHETNSPPNWAPLTLPSAHAEWSINKAASFTRMNLHGESTSYLYKWSWKIAHATLRCWDVLPLPWNWAFQPSLLLQIQRSFLALATTPAHTQAFVSRHVSERQDACWCLFLVDLFGKNKLHLPFIHSENPIQPRVLKPSFFSPGTMALSAPSNQTHIVS